MLSFEKKKNENETILVRSRLLVTTLLSSVESRPWNGLQSHVATFCASTPFLCSDPMYVQDSFTCMPPKKKVKQPTGSRKSFLKFSRREKKKRIDAHRRVGKSGQGQLPGKCAQWALQGTKRKSLVMIDRRRGAVGGREGACQCCACRGGLQDWLCWPDELGLDELTSSPHGYTANNPALHTASFMYVRIWLLGRQ